MSARPKAPPTPGGKSETSFWEAVGLFILMVLMILGFGLLLSVPHPVTQLAAAALS